jgi:hypothetical protein
MENSGWTRGLTGQHKRWLQRALLLVLLVVLSAGVAHAQDENQAGLVVVFGDGRVEQRCVTFAEDSISGYDLLQRSGLPLSVEAGAIGPTVCSIGKEGCSFPAESCFCRCQGGPCVYWSYWRLQADGAWSYQSLGAGNTQVRAGDMEGWRWAAGTMQDAEEPPALSFAAVCGGPSQQAIQPVVEQEISGTSTSVATTTVVTAKTMVSVFAPFGDVEAAAPNAAASENVAPGGMQLLWFVLIGAVAVPATALAIMALLRRGR